MSPGEAPPRRERILFITGKLAEFALRRLLDRLGPERGFEPAIEVLPITVAALMTPEWVAKHLGDEKRRAAAAAAAAGWGPWDRVILPGHCRGDLAAVERAAGAPSAAGPKDLRDLPSWFSGESGAAAAASEPPEGYGAHSIEILAEINGAPRLSSEELLAAAARYQQSGADVIDVGCDPGSVWEGLGEAVRRLRGAGHRVSVDTMEPREMRLAAAAGAELILSVSRSTAEAARDLGCEVVLIPDRPASLEGLEGLEEAAALLAGWKVPFRVDPVLEPIGFGFAASLGRYLEARRRMPGAAMLMGVGNLTELTGADSAAVNVLLAGFCEELAIRSVLTTEVIPWARSAVRELDLARRLVHHAIEHRVLPKHLDPRLHLLRDPRTREHGREVLETLARSLTDPSVRLFAEGGRIHAMSSRFQVSGDDPFELFEAMGIGDASHAFYLGFEMQKALTALTLGKDYVQDQALRWGFLTREEKSHRASAKKMATPGDTAGEGQR